MNDKRENGKSERMRRDQRDCGRTIEREVGNRKREKRRNSEVRKCKREREESTECRYDRLWNNSNNDDDDAVCING